MSPYNITEDFRLEKNKKQNRPVVLVAIEIDDTTTMYFARDNEDVNYFQPRTSVPQLYTKFPFTVGPIGSNVEGQIDVLDIKVANVFQELGGLIQYYGGLLDKKITVILAFKDLLDDPDSCIVNDYYIDSSGGAKQAVEIKATTKFNTLGVRLPFELYNRYQCQFRYMPTPLYQGNATSIVRNVLYDTVNLPLNPSKTLINRVLYLGSFAYRIINVTTQGVIVDRNINPVAGFVTTRHAVNLWENGNFANNPLTEQPLATVSRIDIEQSVLAETYVGEREWFGNYITKRYKAVVNYDLSYKLHVAGVWTLAGHISKEVEMFSGYIWKDTVFTNQPAGVYDFKIEYTSISKGAYIDTVRADVNGEHGRLGLKRYFSYVELASGVAYKIGTECGYFGILTSCDHTIDGANGCEVHDNTIRFGAEPGIPQSRPYAF
jgi:phage-related protein